MIDLHDSYEQFPDSTERGNNPLNFDVDQVGEVNVESGEVPLNLTECALAAKSIGIDVVEARHSFLEEVA